MSLTAINGAFKSLTSVLTTRAQAAAYMGKTYGGNRDVYKVLGYKQDLVFQDYYWRYRRGGVASKVVDAYPRATWRNTPILRSDDEAFVKAWKGMARRLKVYHYLERLDRLAGIGNYAIMVIGTSGKVDLSRPLPNVKNPDDILFLTPYTQGSVKIDSVDRNPLSPRYGYPEQYSVQPTLEFENQKLTTQSFKVHHSRVMHIADNLIESDIIGTPRMEPVWNYLDDLDKIIGGSSEAVWRTVDRGIQFNLDKDAELDPADKENLEEEINNFVHGLQRYIKTQGITANPLGAEIADPSGNFNIVISSIAGTTGIPQRIFMGSEQGQLASTQDERNFSARVKERQVSFAEPIMLRPLIDTFMSIGALPKAEYEVEWPDITIGSAREKADVAARVAQALANFSKQQGISEPVMTPQQFRDIFLNFGADDFAALPALREVIESIETIVEGKDDE